MQIISEPKPHLVDVAPLPSRAVVCLSIQETAAQILENDSFLQPSIFPASRFYGTKRVNYVKTTSQLHPALSSTNQTQGQVCPRFTAFKDDISV